jgi:hypothetical protein
MLDLVSDGSSWEEIVDLAVRIEQAGATIINTGVVLLADGGASLYTTLHYTNTQPSPLVCTLTTSKCLPVYCHV